MVRRLASLLLLSAFLLILSPISSIAEGAIGVIDVQRVFKEYSRTAQAQEKIKKEEDSFKKEVEKGQERITKAREAKKSQEELTKLTKEIEAQLNPQREKLFNLTGQLTSEIQKDIVEAVRSVGAKLGIDTVFDKQAIITGGVDMTEMVITRLNKGK
jgi:Skp family chaperone for outer membrane proteins